MPENTRSAAIVGDPDLSSSQDAASRGGATAPTSGESHAKQILNRVTESAHQAVDRFAEKAGPAVEKIESGVSHANESLAGQAHHMRELGDEWTQSLRTTVRANPLTSILLAVAAGAVIARMTR
jgi:hypothetical protein